MPADRDAVRPSQIPRKHVDEHVDERAGESESTQQAVSKPTPVTRGVLDEGRHRDAAPGQDATNEPKSLERADPDDAATVTVSLDGAEHPPAPATTAKLAASDYERGATVGRYVILSLIGRGGMGTVYAAYDPELDRRVALKILRTGRSASETSRQRLVREARALAQLSDPHVVQVHDVGVHDGHVFLAMEFVDGEPLNEYCKRASPSWREVLSLYIHAARGLAAAHDKGLIHRDIKPANILRARDGRVRVVDFGLAAAHSSEASLDLGEDASESHSSAGTIPPLSTGPGSLPGSLTGRLTVTGTLMGNPCLHGARAARRRLGRAQVER